MKITDVNAIVLRLPEISTAADGTQDDLIIAVETDAGITGYGEVDTAPLVGKAIIQAYMYHHFLLWIAGSGGWERPV